MNLKQIKNSLGKPYFETDDCLIYAGDCLELMKKIDAFVEESKATIINQVKKLGSSLDWSRYAYTLDDARYKAVMEAFVRMYDAGLIYRGNRIVIIPAGHIDHQAARVGDRRPLRPAAAGRAGDRSGARRARGRLREALRPRPRRAGGGLMRYDVMAYLGAMTLALGAGMLAPAARALLSAMAVIIFCFALPVFPVALTDLGTFE